MKRGTGIGVVTELWNVIVGDGRDTRTSYVYKGVNIEGTLES